MKIQPILFNNAYLRLGSIKQKSDSINTSGYFNEKKTGISNIFYYPVNFSSQRRTYKTDKPAFAEKSGDFRIARFPGITCPSCGKKMINHSMMKHIYSDLINLEPGEYLDYIGKYKDYMRPVEASVYDEIYELSQKPGASKDIRELVVSLRDSKLPLLQKVQMRQIKKMRALAKTLPDEEKSVLTKKLNNLQKLVKTNKPSSPFRRKILIDRMAKIKIRNPKKYEKLQMYARSFPTSKDMNSAWIVKYSGKNKMDRDWSSLEIATRFLSSSLANTDHIIAYDIDNNHDDITNYMAMHCSCNSEKGNKPFMQWLYEDKNNRIKNMKQYFKDVDDLITSRRLRKKKYRGYVAYATDTVELASKGQIPASTLRPVRKTNVENKIEPVEEVKTENQQAV